jgi:hypothetical protein
MLSFVCLLSQWLFDCICCKDAVQLEVQWGFTLAGEVCVILCVE